MFLEHEKYTKVPIIITANNLLNHLKGSLSAPVDTIITAGSAQVYGVIKTKCWEWQIDTKGYWSGDLTGLLHSVTISGRPAIPASLAEIGPIRKIQLTMSNLGTDPNNESTHIELVVKPLQIKPQERYLYSVDNVILDSIASHEENIGIGHRQALTQEQTSSILQQLDSAL